MKKTRSTKRTQARTKNKPTGSLEQERGKPNEWPEMPAVSLVQIRQRLVEARHLSECVQQYALESLLHLTKCSDLPPAVVAAATCGDYDDDERPWIRLASNLVSLHAWAIESHGDINQSIIDLYQHVRGLKEQRPIDAAIDSSIDGGCEMPSCPDCADDKGLS